MSALVLPLFSLIVLLLPFTPVLPDQWPVLQALAGPLGAIVWLSVAALQVWVLWQSRLITARAIERWSLTAVTIAIFVSTAAAAGLAAQRLTSTTLFPSGDEPHYLVIAQSLWRDGDLKIENNHQRGDYREYYPGDLDPHYLTRGTDREIYSIHPIGIAVLLAPIYALGRLPGRGVGADPDGRARRRAGLAVDGRHPQRARRRDVRVGGDRAVRAVHVQHLHDLSGNRRRRSP